MAKTIWTENYLINSFLVNPQKKLGIYSLLNTLQDAAWIHATQLGHGFEDMLKKKTIWVLTRQSLEMKSWPAWGEELQIRTWIRPPQGPFANRDFEIIHQDKIIGLSTTSWLMMNIDSRAPVRAELQGNEAEFRTDYQVPMEAGKIKIRTDLKEVAQFQVRNSDLDMNDHVNNTRYAQWVLDSIPKEFHKRFKLKNYEVNFLAETHADDLITIQKSPDQEWSAQNHWIQFQGFREKDQKIVFASRLEASE